MFHQFLIPDGRLPLVNLAKAEMIHKGETIEFKTEEGTIIGPSVQIWFDNDRYLVVNSTIDEIIGLLDQ